MHTNFFAGLFIIDGIITIPIALLGFLIMPDLPTTTKPSFIFTEADLNIGKRRMEEIGRKPPAHFTKAKVNNKVEQGPGFRSSIVRC